VALLADAPVNALAQQVGVAVVPGVLLDHVDQELTQGDRCTGAVLSDEAEVGVEREPFGKTDLIPPGATSPVVDASRRWACVARTCGGSHHLVSATGVPAVPFDVDGTLVDSNYLQVIAWTEAFRSVGHPVDSWRGAPPDRDGLRAATGIAAGG